MVKVEGARKLLRLDTRTSELRRCKPAEPACSRIVWCTGVHARRLVLHHASLWRAYMYACQCECSCVSVSVGVSVCVRSHSLLRADARACVCVCFHVSARQVYAC